MDRFETEKSLIKGDILLVLKNEETGYIKTVWGKNIVTDQGDKYYAQKACGESPTKAFGYLYLATAGPVSVAKDDDYSDFTVASGSAKYRTDAYPKTADGDGDNTGAGVDIVSWKFEYLTTDGPFTDVTHSFISISGATGSEAVLNSYKWGAAWSKDAATSAKIFANHEMLGS